MISFVLLLLPLAAYGFRFPTKPTITATATATATATIPPTTTTTLTTTHSATTALHAKRKGVSPNKGPKKKASAEFIIIDDIYSDEWKLDVAVQSLKNGGVVVIPTDTCYSFATLLSNDNRDGMERLIKVKGGGRKPLSAICKDISTAATIVNLNTDKWIFKLLKGALPGPFTFIMPTSASVPKMIIDRKHHKLSKISRKEIGIRIPDDPICTAILEQLDHPLLCGSVPQAAEDELGLEWLKSIASSDEDEDEEDYEYEYDEEEEGAINYSDTTYHELHLVEDLNWVKDVDVVVLSGPRGGGDKSQLTTIVDLTQALDGPHIVRQGKGILPLISL